jgi:hypothetical protein
MIPTRYKNMDDDEWQKFGGALRWWANNEYRMMLGSKTSAERSVAELAYSAAIDSLAKYCIVYERERDRELSVDEAVAMAHTMVRNEHASELDKGLKI